MIDEAVGELPVDGLAGDEGAIVDRPEKLVGVGWHGPPPHCRAEENAVRRVISSLAAFGAQSSQLASRYQAS